MGCASSTEAEQKKKDIAKEEEFLELLNERAVQKEKDIAWWNKLKDASANLAEVSNKFVRATDEAKELATRLDKNVCKEECVSGLVVLRTLTEEIKVLTIEIERWDSIILTIEMRRWDSIIEELGN